MTVLLTKSSPFDTLITEGIGEEMSIKKNSTEINGPQKARRTDRFLIAQTKRFYPVSFCHLELDGHIDIPRLKVAITQSSQIVPELLCSFDIKKERWVDQGFTADRVILEDTRDFGKGWRWDLFSDTQFKISVCHHEKGDSLIFALSHILSDGVGSMQYLRLLMDFYNGGTVPAQTKNNRDIRPLIRDIRPKPLPAGERYSKKNKMAAARHLPLDDSRDHSSPAGKEYGYCLRERVSADELTALKAYAKSQGCTVNGAVLAAYARVVARILDTDFVVLPCPTDLRPFLKKKPALTIANMVGLYMVPVTIGSDDGFGMTVRQIHKGLLLRKKHRRCFTGLRSLGRIGDILPPAIAHVLERMVSFILPISYTFTGALDDQLPRFEGCVVTDCFLTGPYRHSPDFQLTVSGFRGELSLVSTVLGSSHRRALCHDILKQIKSELVTRGAHTS
jgi:NRPS condensation-like uncharacterized protein